MRHAGFVLTGGRSSRMGQDKALLPYRGGALGAHVAKEVLAATGEVTLLGDPSIYAFLGFPVVADLVPPCGPAGGLFTALTVTDTDWNLLVACDMPEADRTDFTALLAAARETGANCVVPRDADGHTHPLCAVYHRSCLPRVATFIEDKILKMQEIVLALEPFYISLPNPQHLANINSPQDWTHYSHVG